MRGSTLLSESLAVFGKELTAEMRSRVALNAIGLFGLTTLIAVAYQIGPYKIQEEVPSSAIGPDRMLCIPMRNVLACALATQGAASREAAPPANIVRRVISPLIERPPMTC